MEAPGQGLSVWFPAAAAVSAAAEVFCSNCGVNKVSEETAHEFRATGSFSFSKNS